MVYNFRFDYMKLEDEDFIDAKDVADGSTLYEVDTQHLYLAYKGKWYAQFKEESEENAESEENEESEE